jgi:hypothetical protein
MTQMGDAMRAAGFVPTQERLRTICIEVLAVHGDRSTAAIEALYARLLPDRELLIELFAPYREQALRRALALTVDAMREEARLADEKEPKARSGGQRSSGPHVSAAPAARPARSGGHKPSDPYVGPASTPLLTAADVLLGKMASRRGAEEVAGNIMRLSRLETFMIGDPKHGYVKLGDTNCGHVRAWARARGMESRWLFQVVGNQPAHYIVREHVTPEWVDACWRETVEQDAAA